MDGQVRCPSCGATIEEERLIAAAGTCPSCAATLPIIDRHPPGWREWARTVAHGRRRWGRVRYLRELERTRQRAEESAGRGDYAEALRWLETLEALGEPLSQEWEARRRSWHEALHAARVDTASGARPSDPGRGEPA